ncbi:phosphoribosyl-AMP cyclohydrolase [Sediminitomix flava]|nr:phosphoribosyl-AMP cyclohydrolase [Sediminitomix flava]
MDKQIIELEEGLNCDLQFEKRNGLLPVAVQEYSTGQILMLASVNQEAFDITVKTGKATFWSTSRNSLWTKGETSGDFLKMEKILVDCDQDALIFQVTLQGSGSCHTYDQEGKHRKTCFYRELDLEEKKLAFIKELK